MVKYRAFKPICQAVLNQNASRWFFVPLFLCFVLFFETKVCRAAFEDRIAGARPAALAGAFVACDGVENSANPAALGAGGPWQMQLAYLKPYGLANLHHTEWDAVLPVAKGRTGLSIRTFGSEKYRETAFSAAGSIPLSPGIFVGAALRYLRLEITHYGEAASVAADVGFLIRLSENVRWGTTIKNINQARIGTSRQPLPEVMTTGLELSPVRPVRLFFDLSKDVRFPADLRLGVEYSPISILVLRAGMGSEPQRVAAGFSLGLGRFRLDYAWVDHAELGPTHVFSVVIPRKRS